MTTLLQTSNIVAVIIVFSFLIFVHELGHYLAAIITGVRVEKFMIGFDVWGLGLRRKIKGVEYGIGLLPLGGYVKLAGQSDLPGEEECTGAPDELMSKSIAARTLIFVGGVFMNFLFGFIILVAANLYGVPRVPPVIDAVVENSPAAAASLQSGDRVVAIDGNAITSFNALATRVAMSTGSPMIFTVERTLEEGKTIQLRRRIVAQPGMGRGNIYKIGAQPPTSNEVALFYEDLPTAESIQKEISVGDRIVGVNDTIISPDGGSTFENMVSTMPGRKVTLRVKPEDSEKEKTITSRVLALGTYDIGLRYQATIINVAEGSPAAEAGLQKGDRIISVDGKMLTQKQPLSYLILSAAFRSIDISVRRDGEEISVPVRPASMGFDPRVKNGNDTYLGVLVEKTAEGQAYRVTHVLEAGPAEGKLREGDQLLSLQNVLIDTDKPLAEQVEKASSHAVDLEVMRGEEILTRSMRPEVRPGMAKPVIGIHYNPNGAIYGVAPDSIAEELGLGPQDRLAAFSVSPDLSETTITWKREGREKPLQKTIKTPLEVREDPVAAGLAGTLGFKLMPNFVMERAPSFWAACAMAGPDFIDKTFTIYHFLERLVSARISPTAMGGPILIVQAMVASADVGWGKLLDMAAFISINLAVLNLLPLPVLDGGHVLFLIIEWIKGSRPSAKVREYAQYAGFFLLMGLMLMVTAFDVYYTWLQSWLGN